MPKSRLTPLHQCNRIIQEVTPCPAYIASPTLTARVKTYDFVQLCFEINAKLQVLHWKVGFIFDYISSLCMKLFIASANVTARFRKKCSRGILKMLVASSAWTCPSSACTLYHFRRWCKAQRSVVADCRNPLLASLA